MVAERDVFSRSQQPISNSHSEEPNIDGVIHLPGGIDINTQKNIVVQNGALVSFGYGELEVFKHLAFNAGRAISRREIIDTACISPKSLSNYIHSIRMKLGIDPRGILKTVRNFGYMIEDKRENPKSVIKADEGVEVDLNKRQVKRNGEIARMTPTEYRLMETLAINIGNVIPKREIVNQLWEEQELYSFRQVGYHIQHIKRTLGVSPNGVIRIIRRQGVVLRAAEMEAAGTTDPLPGE